jgi:WD40 repeat protein
LFVSDKLATGAFDGSSRVWGVESGKTITEFTGGQSGSEVWSIAFSPDSEMIATGCADHRVFVWDTLNGIELMKLEVSKSSTMDIYYKVYLHRVIVEK